METTKNKRKVNPNSLANLRPFTSQTKKEARLTGARGGVRSGEVRKEKARQRDTIRKLLQCKVKDLPLTRERIDELCKDTGVLPDTLVNVAHCVSAIVRALCGDHYYSTLLLQCDGSLDPHVLVTDSQVKFVVVNLHPEREQYARRAIEGVMDHFTPEDKEHVRKFLDSLDPSHQLSPNVWSEDIPDIDD